MVEASGIKIFWFEGFFKYNEYYFIFKALFQQSMKIIEIRYVVSIVNFISYSNPSKTEKCYIIILVQTKISKLI